MKNVILLALIAFAPSSFAAVNKKDVKAGSENVVAATVQQVSDVSDKKIGQIVFELDTQSYRAFAGSTGGGAGAWLTLSSPVNQFPVTSETNLRMETLSMNTACNSSPCSTSNYTQSGSWVSSVTRSATGNYSLNLNSGVFSAAPTCTGSALDGGGQVVSFFGITSTNVPTFTLIGASNTYSDVAFSVICVGPR